MMMSRGHRRIDAAKRTERSIGSRGRSRDRRVLKRRRRFHCRPVNTITQGRCVVLHGRADGSKERVIGIRMHVDFFYNSLRVPREHGASISRWLGRRHHNPHLLLVLKHRSGRQWCRRSSETRKMLEPIEPRAWYTDRNISTTISANAIADTRKSDAPTDSAFRERPSKWADQPPFSKSPSHSIALSRAVLHELRERWNANLLEIPFRLAHL